MSTTGDQPSQPTKSDPTSLSTDVNPPTDLEKERNGYKQRALKLIGERDGLDKSSADYVRDHAIKTIEIKEAKADVYKYEDLVMEEKSEMRKREERERVLIMLIMHLLFHLFLH